MGLPRRRLAATFVLSALSAALAGCGTSPAFEPEIPSPRALVWGHPFPELTILVQYVQGFRPSDRAMAQLVETLEEVTDKRTVTLQGPVPLAGYTYDPDRIWSEAALDGIYWRLDESHGRGRGETAFLFVSYLDGGPEDESLGLRVQNHLYVFEKGVRADYAGGALPRAGAENKERAVLMHEVGHALGLVNCGIPMLTPREYADGDCHSTDRGSVMYPGMEDWRPDVDAITGREGMLAPISFTADDLRDLENFRRMGREGAARTAG